MLHSNSKSYWTSWKLDQFRLARLALNCARTALERTFATHSVIYVPSEMSSPDRLFQPLHIHCPQFLSSEPTHWISRAIRSAFHSCHFTVRIGSNGSCFVSFNFRTERSATTYCLATVFVSSFLCATTVWTVCVVVRLMSATIRRTKDTPCTCVSFLGYRVVHNRKQHRPSTLNIRFTIDGFIKNSCVERDAVAMEKERRLIPSGVRRIEQYGVWSISLHTLRATFKLIKQRMKRPPQGSRLRRQTGK